jgi:hypothetical protein
MRYSFLFSKIHLFSYLNVVGEGQIVHESSSPKITRAKWTAGVTQKVGNLFCKHDILNSKPSPTKVKEKCIK